MAIRTSEQPQVSIPPAPPLPSPAEQLRTRVCNTVFKTGPLFLSSKGIGWTSWKKRWFILTRTSLVFFRSDPSAVPQKGSEVNLTLGGIDLNNSGSVVVKADKKLLTVIFPDGRDGRTFTLKAETLEDLQEWKTALESALAQAPNHPMGQNGIFRTDQIDSVDGSLDQFDRPPVKISVIGRPILLALEDVDGSPSFLEKALQFIEEHGVKIEGILRQAADVDDVERRVREYEQGKNEFSFEEDAHVIADCVKYVIRELPSSPVPASCCKALLQACRTERSIRVNAMRTAICETFPEPNRRLLQRILMMMKKVATHKAENRMSCPAVAACMAPLLLRPLLACECEIENDFDLGGDGSVQLLQAAAAANHAQAIVITLLDEYDKIFGEGSVLLEPYTDSEESGSESEGATDDDESYEDENDHGSQGSDSETEGDPENSSSVTCSERGDSGNKSPYDNKESAGSISGSDSSEVDDNNKTEKNLSSSSLQTPPLQPDVQRSEDKPTQNSNNSAVRVNDSPVAPRETTPQTSSISKPVGHGIPACIQISTTSNVPEHILRKRRTWGRTAGRKNLSLESIDYGEEDEVEVQRLEFTKYELKNRIMEEVKENAVVQTNLEIRKKDLHQRRLTLEIEVAQLKKQLQKERDLRVTLEAGLHMSHGTLPNLDTVDEKTKADLEEIAVAEAVVVSLTQKLVELGMHFNRQRELHHGSTSKSGNLPQKIRGHQTRLMDKQKENEVNSPSYFEKSRNKDSHLDGTEIEYESKVESASVSNKHLPRIQKTDSLSSSKYSSIEASVDTSTPKSAVSKRSSSRRSSTKVEGSVSTNAALTKLTTRLNFLKERRNQIAHDLQNVDIRGSPRVVQSPIKGREQYLNEDRSQGSEAKATQNSERVREIDSYNLIQNQDRSVGKEGQPSQNPEKLRKVESQSLGYPDRSKRSEVHDFHSLERGKSENHKSLNIDKVRVVEGGQPFMPSRTSTR